MSPEERPIIISGLTFLDWLYEQGVIPEQTQRVIIDAAYDDAVIIYIQAIGDDRLMEEGNPLPMLDVKFAELGEVAQ